MNYTKGKWHLGEKDYWHLIYDGDGALVADMDIVIRDVRTNLANAQLIASAPDLYEALKLTRNNLQTLSGAAIHYKKAFSANLEIINQALAKAEGIK